MKLCSRGSLLILQKIALHQAEVAPIHNYVPESSLISPLQVQSCSLTAEKQGLLFQVFSMSHCALHDLTREICNAVSEEHYQAYVCSSPQSRYNYYYTCLYECAEV